MEAEREQRRVDEHGAAAEQERLPHHQRDHRQVAGVAHALEGAAHHEPLGRRDRRRRTEPFAHEAYEEGHEHRQRREDQQDTEHAQARARRQPPTETASTARAPPPDPARAT